MDRKKAILNELKSLVLSYDDTAKVILFGSRARGDNRIDSDWDILVLTDQKADFVFQRKLRDDITDIELQYVTPFSTIIMNKSEWQGLQKTPFYKRVVAEGQVL